MPYLTGVSTDRQEITDAFSVLFDTHPDTVWEGKLENDGLSLTLDFGAGQVTFSHLRLLFANAAKRGIKKIGLEYCGQGGEWKTLCEDAVFSPQTQSDSQEAEYWEIALPEKAGSALRLSVKETISPYGNFDLAEIELTGTKTEFPIEEKEITIEAKLGDKITLPDFVENEGQKFPVSWEEKQVFCNQAGTEEVAGWIGTQRLARAVIHTSEETAAPALQGHWAWEAVCGLRQRGILSEQEMLQIHPETEASRLMLAKWLYQGLAVWADYMPERVSLTQKAYYSDTEETAPNELAVLGILPWKDNFDSTLSLTRWEAAEIFCRALEYEKEGQILPEEPIYFTDIDGMTEEQKQNLRILAAAGITANEGIFDGNRILSETEMFFMLEKLLEATETLTVYPRPDSEKVPGMPDYTVKVNGQEIDTYATYIFPGMSGREDTINGRPVTEAGVAYFDFSGKAEVEITLHQAGFDAASGVRIRPLSEEIVPTVLGNTIRFTLYQPCNLSIEPWGLYHPLQLFANPTEKNLPDLQEENVWYYGPGVHEIDPAALQNGDTVYVAGGAVVFTKPQAETTDGGTYYGVSLEQIEPTFAAAGEGITVRGRGILSGRNTFAKQQRHQLLRIHGCREFRADGLILLECSAWNVFVAARSDDVYLNNLKMVGYFANNDGIDFCDSENAVVENCYANNADDSFLIKAWSSVENVHFRHCTAWNSVSTSFGAVCELYQPISNVTFSDCTVIHSTNPMWMEDSGGVIGIWDNFAADICDVQFENVVIEDAVCGKEPIKINVEKDPENPEKEAKIQDISFRNISVLDSRDQRIALTTPFAEGICGVVFENTVINGTPVASAEDSRFVLENAKDITVRP